MRILHRRLLRWVPVIFLGMGSCAVYAWTQRGRWAQQTDMIPKNSMAQATSVRRPKNILHMPDAATKFQPGKVKALGEPYTKRIVVPRSGGEDVDWIQENFKDDASIEAAVYHTDGDLSGVLHPPKNKGHEVMAYLSYIIDHYNNLSDVNIFLHSHRYAWHNNDLLGGDAVQMVKRLSAERVQREGFMNMRCHWSPGCPDWMHPGSIEEDVNRQEETLMARAWLELFPNNPIPKVLAQPCCAQFAISRDRIRSMPLSQYVFYRDWLLRTSLSDYISGRVWEYIWQYVFTGQHVLCVEEHVCYCDGFGVCFGGEAEYEDYWAKGGEKRKLEKELEAWKAENEMRNKVPKHEKPVEMVVGWVDEVGRGSELEGRIQGLVAWADRRRRMALERGDTALSRAEEAGRKWGAGDGF